MINCFGTNETFLSFYMCKERNDFVLKPLYVLIQILPYGISIYLTFLVTICIYPAITMQIVSTSDVNTKWASTFYVPVVVFLLHDMSDYAGRAFAGLLKWPGPGKKGVYVVFVMALLRISFLPLILLCNICQRVGVPPVLFLRVT